MFAHFEAVTQFSPFIPDIYILYVYIYIYWKMSENGLLQTGRQTEIS